MGWIVRSNGKGRIVIPREVRNRLGLGKNSILTLEIRDNEVVLTAPLDLEAFLSKK
jgi:AbrB family looped-hinge helix DNA binding protein